MNTTRIPRIVLFLHCLLIADDCFKNRFLDQSSQSDPSMEILKTELKKFKQSPSLPLFPLPSPPTFSLLSPSLSLFLYLTYILAGLGACSQRPFSTKITKKQEVYQYQEGGKCTEREGRDEERGFPGALVNLHCPLDWTLEFVGDTFLGMFVEVSPERLTGEDRPSLEVDSTIPWAR